MSVVFEQSSLATIPLGNRIIRSATHEAMADESGRPLESLSRLYERLAQGGVGAIITGIVGVQANSVGYPRMLMLHHDEYVDAYQEVLEPVKKIGTPVIAQLNHVGGKGHPSVANKEIIGPSRKKFSPYGVVAKAMEEHEIEEIVDSYVQTVHRAKKAGFDAVQLHAAHGYLLSQFLSPQYNRRTDEWGGDTERRFRIIAEILRGSRQVVGNYPVLMKLSAYDGDKGGMNVAEAVKIVKLFEAAGGAAVEISCGVSNPFEMIRVNKIPVEAALNLDPHFRSKPNVVKKVLSVMLPYALKKAEPLHNYNVEAAAEVKKHVGIPVIVVGGLRKLDDMEQTIEQDKADFVSLSRPLIIEPELVNKFREGKQKESRCIDCAYCLIGTFSGPLRCYYGKI